MVGGSPINSSRRNPTFATEYISASNNNRNLIKSTEAVFKEKISKFGAMHAPSSRKSTNLYTLATGNLNFSCDQHNNLIRKKH